METDMLVREIEDAISALQVCADMESMSPGCAVILADQIRRLIEVVESLERKQVMAC